MLSVSFRLHLSVEIVLVLLRVLFALGLLLAAA